MAFVALPKLRSNWPGYICLACGLGGKTCSMPVHQNDLTESCSIFRAQRPRRKRKTLVWHDYEYRNQRKEHNPLPCHVPPMHHPVDDQIISWYALTFFDFPICTFTTCHCSSSLAHVKLMTCLHFSSGLCVCHLCPVQIEQASTKLHDLHCFQCDEAKKYIPISHRKSIAPESANKQHEIRWFFSSNARFLALASEQTQQHQRDAAFFARRASSEIWFQISTWKVVILSIFHIVGRVAQGWNIIILAMHFLTGCVFACWRSSNQSIPQDMTTSSSIDLLASTQSVLFCDLNKQGSEVVFATQTPLATSAPVYKI